MNHHAFNLTFGQVIDMLEEGQIAEYDNKGIGFIILRHGKFYHGTDENAVLSISKYYMESKWRITPFFERRICECGCEAPLLPKTEQYAKDIRASNHTRDYYYQKAHKQKTMGLCDPID